MNDKELHVLNSLCSTLSTCCDAQRVTAHFARPRGIFVVAESSNHQTLHYAHRGWSHLLLHCANHYCIYSSTHKTPSSCHKSHMWDHSVSMRTYVKHVLAYDNVSEQARKGFLCLWCDGHFSVRAFLRCPPKHQTSLIYLTQIRQPRLNLSAEKSRQMHLWSMGEWSCFRDSPTLFLSPNSWTHFVASFWYLAVWIIALHWWLIRRRRIDE